MDISTCSPIANAAVTLWHCDAIGLYSHFIQASQNVQNPRTDNSTFLRGIQLTNASGVATFDTIYPGWYNGRATHMHVKVHLGGTYLSETSYYSGAKYVHTGQLFFNDSLTDLVNQQSPYDSKTGSRMQNSQDNIYSTTGAYTLMNVQYVNAVNSLSGGSITSVALGVDSPTETATSISSTAGTNTVSTRSSSSTPATTTVRSSSTRSSTTTQPNSQPQQRPDQSRPGQAAGRFAGNGRH